MDDTRDNTHEQRDVDDCLDDGWVKLHRRMLQTRAFQNPEVCKVWLWCMLKATYKRRWVSVRVGRGDTEVELMPGQFIFGRKSAAKELRMKPSSVHDRMEKLRDMQNIVIQPNTHYSVITVCNWETYQSGRDEVRHHTRQASDTQPTPNRHPTDTNKKVKKDQERPTTSVRTYDVGQWPAERLATLWHEGKRLATNIDAPATEKNRRLIYGTIALVMAGEISSDEIQEAYSSTIDNHPDNPVGYFKQALIDILAARNPPAHFGTLLRRVALPATPSAEGTAARPDPGAGSAGGGRGAGAEDT